MYDKVNGFVKDPNTLIFLTRANHEVQMFYLSAFNIVLTSLCLTPCYDFERGRMKILNFIRQKSG